MRRNPVIYDHLNKVNQLLDLLFVRRVFSFCPLPQFLEIRLIVDGRRISRSDYRTVSCTDIINITLTLFSFFPSFLDFGHIERFYFFLMFLEERRRVSVI